MSTTKNMKKYVPLHFHSHYSILDGYGTVEEYISVAKSLGLPGLGLSDHGNASGLYKFITQSQKEGLIAIPGIEFYVAPENPQGALCLQPVYYGKNGKAPKYDVSAGAYTHITVFAYNNTGLSNLFKLTSMSWLPQHFYVKPRIDTNMLAEHSEGLIVTTGCPSSEVNRRFLLGQDDKAYEYASRLKSIFGDNLYIEVMNHSMEDEELERILLPKQIKLSKDLGIKMIATNDSHYALSTDAEPHERILAVSTKNKMKELPFHKGGKRFAFSTPEYYIKTYDEMLKCYPEDIAEELLNNTLEIMDKCKDIKLEYDPHLRPEVEIPEGYTPATYLQKLIFEGYKTKRGQESKEIQAESIKRIKEEFEVLHSNDFISYFLVVHDYIDYAHKQGIGVGAGRGCFLPGSKVKSNQGSLRNIEDIKVGQKVQTHDTTYQIVEDTFVYDVVNEDMITLKLSNGKEIKATSDHLIFHKERGFIKAENFVVGDIVLGPKGRKEKYEMNCGACSKLIYIDKQTFDERSVKSSYKPAGEYWCYDCVKHNLINIPAVIKGMKKGTERQKDDDVRIKMSKSLKKHWSENYGERLQKWRDYMGTPEYKKTNEERRKRMIEFYSDPVELNKLTRQGRSGYKTGYFTSYQQAEKKIYYASSYELKALTILETDSTVKAFDRCMFRVPYIKPSTGLEHNYLPDFEVTLKDETLTVIEVKAEWQLKEKDTASKLAQAKAFFEEKGINFEVWTENTFKELNDDWHNDIEVVSVEKFKYTGKVHDIQVANVHNYNVEGVTVHNSVGGSEIAYVLDISNTDPIRFNLLFERFLSPGRGSLYQIDYATGESEEIAVSAKKRVKSSDGTEEVVYVHELYPGDTVNYEDKNLVIKDVYVKIPGSAPDVDTDFHTEGREQVVQYCVDKYGKDNVANIVTFGTFKAKRAFKAMCNIYDVPFALANTASNYIPGVQGAEASLRELMDPTSPRYNEGADFRGAVENAMFDEVVEMAIALDGRISETGAHPCGVIISNQPLAGIIPTQVRQLDNKTITQWEYPELESLGLIKMDMLGLELINTIQQTLENIRLTNESAVDRSLIREVPDMRKLILGPMNDKATFETLQEGNTVGIFQLGSQGVRELLRKAKPETFMEIANITALYRPGPMKSGAPTQYADRKSGKEEISYIHKDFLGTEIQEILEETFGLLIFQEQIMLIAGRYAGFTPYETDQLRSAIGKKKMKVMMEMKPKFIKGCLARGCSQEAVDTLWETIEVFGQYGFNKSHSVSYAINIYQTVYLKTHYPSEFMAALIQQGFGNPNKVRMSVQEAMRMQLKLGPVDINTSQVQMASTGVNPKNKYDIVFGFSGVRQTNEILVKAIVDERNKNGLYKSVADFVSRIVKVYPLTSAPLSYLALAGAFDSFGVSRKQVSEKAKMFIDSSNIKVNKGASLFDLMTTQTSDSNVAEAIDIQGEDFGYNELIKKEAEAIGMFVSGHPTSNLGHIANRYQATSLSKIMATGGGKEEFTLLGTVTQMESKTNKAGNRSIALLIDDGVDTVVTYLPKEVVQSIEKYEELERIAKSKGKGTSTKANKRAEKLAEIVNNPKIIPMKPVEMNDPYMFKVKTRGWGENLKVIVNDIVKLNTAPDGSLPYEVKVSTKSMLSKLNLVIDKHKDEKGTYVKVHVNDKEDILLKTRVKLSLDFIIDMEKALGKENIITEGI